MSGGRSDSASPGLRFLAAPLFSFLELAKAFRTKVASETPTSGFFLFRCWPDSFFLGCLCPTWPAGMLSLSKVSCILENRHLSKC